MLNDTKRHAAELYAKGEKVTDIARLCKVSRTSVYDWLKMDEFKAEVDRSLNELKAASEKKIAGNLETYIQELERIALTGKSEKNRMDALQYLVNRTLGNTTTKTEVTTTNTKEDKKITWDDLNLLTKKEDKEEETYLS